MVWASNISVPLWDTSLNTPEGQKYNMILEIYSFGSTPLENNFAKVMEKDKDNLRVDRW